MNKQVAILPFAVAGALLIGCSDKAEESNPVTNPILGQQDPATTPYIDPVTGDYVNPETGETVPGIQVTDPETGETVTVPVVIPDPVSSASQQGNEQPGVSSASTDPATNPTDPQNPNQSPVNPTSSAEVLYQSSSSLKEYDDNHKAKATFLPKAGFYSNLTIEPLSRRQRRLRRTPSSAALNS